VRTVNKSDLILVLAGRTKLTKVDAGRAVEALFAPNGVIATELRKGAKVQITGFGNFEARKRGARVGRNPQNGREIQIKASVAPVFRSGKLLKEAVNKRK
jgi:DNA-binding protein HU-beta